MLPSNNKTERISREVRKILENTKYGWMRTNECAKAYSKGNESKRTNFYRWKRKVDKQKIIGFQSIQVGKASFIGLREANPVFFESEVLEDKNILKSISLPSQKLGLFDWLDKQAERMFSPNKEELRRIRRRKYYKYKQLLAKRIRRLKEKMQKPVFVAEAERELKDIQDFLERKYLEIEN